MTQRNAQHRWKLIPDNGLWVKPHHRSSSNSTKYALKQWFRLQWTIFYLCKSLLIDCTFFLLFSHLTHVLVLILILILCSNSITFCFQCNLTNYYLIYNFNMWIKMKITCFKLCWGAWRVEINIKLVLYI